MKQFTRVVAFSFLSQARTKGMIISTIIICVVIAIGMSVPSAIDFFRGDEPGAPGFEPGENGAADEPGETGEEGLVIVVDPEGILFTDTDSLTNRFPSHEWRLESGEQAVLEEQVQNDEIHSALLVEDRMNVTYIYKSDINVFGTGLADALQTYLIDRHRFGLLQEHNVSEEDAARFFDVPMLEHVNVGMENMIGQVQGMVLMFLLYMTILGSGQLVSTSVAQEKSSRAMEILITTSRPETLMFGKVTGIGLLGLLQTVTFILVGAIFYFINQDALISVEMLGEILAVPLSTFVYALIFFLGGYFFYAMLFAAVGSLVSRTEDLATVSTPMTMFTLAGFFIALYGQLYGFADTLFFRICSYIPLTAPYVMLTRITAEPNIPWWEIALSIGVLYLSTAAVGILSAKIYRVGVLIYGKRPTFKEVFAALKQA